jgi:hypothetical protein
VPNPIRGAAGVAKESGASMLPVLCSVVQGGQQGVGASLSGMLAASPSVLFLPSAQNLSSAEVA